MRCYSYHIRSSCYLPVSKGRSAFHSWTKPNDGLEAVLLQGPRVMRCYQSKVVWYLEAFSACTWPDGGTYTDTLNIINYCEKKKKTHKKPKCYGKETSILDQLLPALVHTRLTGPREQWYTCTITSYYFPLLILTP